MNPSVKITRKQAEPLLKRSFPNYSGRKFRVEFTETVTVHDTNWGDGTRNYYVALNANGVSTRITVPAPWLNLIEGQTTPLGPDVLVVMHSIFCGKDLGITIYANPVNAPKWIEAGK